MSLPESMSRVVIVGGKNRLEETVNALFKVGAIHLIDYTNDSDEGLSIGAPLPFSSKASERLLKIRAATKDLGIDAAKAEFEPFSLDDIKARISSGEVETVEKTVFDAIEERNRIAQRITESELKAQSLEDLSKLPLKLEDYSGYESLTVIVGTVKDDCSEQLAQVPNAEFFISASDKKSVPVVAVFVANSDKDKASAVLSEHGFAEMAVPAGTGAPADMLASVKQEIEEAKAALEAVNVRIADLAEKHGSFLVASDEELSDEVSRGEVPLRIATTEYSYVIDAWVPTAKTSQVEKGLKDILGEGVYMEVQETRSRKMHDEEAAEPRFKKTPTKWKNGKYAKRYEYPVSLVSVPKYQELDPSLLVGIFFPLFFGFMVGDLGYAIPFIVLGAYGIKVAKSKDFQAIATVLFFGGIWAAIFGTFFFGEMLGMHFVGPGDELQHTWESLLGVTLPEWFTGAMIGGHGISKIGEEYIGFLLKLTVYIGIVHILISYFVGLYNATIQHGFKDAMHHKGGWIFSTVGIVLLCYAITQVMFSGNPLEGMLLYLLIAGVVCIVIGVVLGWPAEGAQAVLELPGIVGNILSYTRLAAIGMSKAGMALAFNYIALIMLAGIGSTGGSSIVGIIFGALVFLIGHLMIWVLAILSAGLHGLRLQYVESMNKFFDGGGVEYAPLKTRFKHIIKTAKMETEV